MPIPRLFVESPYRAPFAVQGPGGPPTRASALPLAAHLPAVRVQDAGALVDRPSDPAAGETVAWAALLPHRVDRRPVGQADGGAVVEVADHDRPPVLAGVAHVLRGQVRLLVHAVPAGREREQQAEAQESAHGRHRRRAMSFASPASISAVTRATVGSSWMRRQ